MTSYVFYPDRRRPRNANSPNALRAPPDTPYNAIRMPPAIHPRRRRPARTQWGVLAFLVLFTLGLIALTYYYLLPAHRAFLKAKADGDQHGVHAISATSALLMAVILIILISGLLLTFRIGRLFFPRNAPPRTKTQYIDAWAESGKRMETPPEE
ncbi:MAG: hypothetical protein JWN40_1629 [Phycisphaerales bacterium]|nr:hypothetical protein [Phycisphaerales bacterium]